MVPQRYPGHVLKQTFTKFLAEATLPHLKCSFYLVIVAQKEEKLFYTLYVIEMSNKCFISLKTLTHHSSYSQQYRKKKIT